ncbi:MAG: ABC transporter permease [Chryseolinea sp.]
MNSKFKVPGWPHAFFKWYCEPQRYEEIHGDLEEVFYETAEKSGHRVATIYYLLNVIRCCQPYAWRRRQSRTSSGFVLYKSYFTVALRGLLKNPVNSFINVFGLSIAVGICILVYGYYQWDHDIDRFHKNKDEVFLLTWFGNQNGTLHQYGSSPRAVGPMLKNDFAHIKKVCRIEDGGVIVKYADNVFHEQVRYVDPEFLEMFTFPMKWGSSESLYDINSTVLSEDMSIKYFGNDNPVGRDILIKFNEKDGKAFKVAGVAAPFPKAHDIEFNILINFENLRVADPDYKFDDWSKTVGATLIQVDDVHAIKQIEEGLGKYRTLHNDALQERPVTNFAFEQLTTLHQKAANIRDAIASDYNVEGRIGLPVIACLMLALACFNSINIAIVSATRRLKEIGVRKVIGASRGRMVVQFLSENMITTLLALALGLVLSVTVFIPAFVQFSGGEMQFDVLDSNLLIFLFGLLILTGVTSGLYPAFYISRFDAVKIFKGSVEFGKKNPLTKMFLAVQLVLAFVLITTGVVFTQNNVYQSNLSWGYDYKDALYVSLPDSTSFQKLQAVVSSDPNVEMFSGSTDHVGKRSSPIVIHLPSSKQFEADQFAVDANYFQTMGLELSDGRLFRDRSQADRRAVVVNELLAESLGIANVIGTTVEIDSMRYEVVGILKDFHARNLFNKIRPTIFKLAGENEYEYLSMRVKPGTENRVFAFLQTRWAKLFPEIPFQGGLQKDVWGIYFDRVDRSQNFSIVIATIAVFLASMGLFGLVMMNVSGRTKEFSIRKTLGARAADIMQLIMNQYVLLIGIALIVGLPASYLFARASLNMLFAYPIPMGYSGIVTAGIIVIVIFLSVVATQIRKVLKANPVEGLRME